MNRAKTVIEAMSQAKNNPNMKSVCVGNDTNGYVHYERTSGNLSIDSGGLFVVVDDITYDDTADSLGNTIWAYRNDELIGSLHLSDVTTTIYVEYFEGYPSYDKLY